MSLIFSTNLKLFEQAELIYGKSEIPENEYNLYLNTKCRAIDSLLPPNALSLNTWTNPVKVNFESISEATKILKSVQRNWVLYPTDSIRRSKLIEEGLPKIQSKPLNFGDFPPKSPIGSWTLLNKNTLLYASACTQNVPYGIYSFIEDQNIPSRAYLKLWEFFTRFQISENLKKLNAIDLGACPGGWTWVLSKIFNTVVSIDKAPLDEKINKLKNVVELKQDLLKLDLENFMNSKDISWIFCDAALEPAKIIKYITPAVSNLNVKFVCTLKLTQTTNLNNLKEALSIPGSQLIHLSANKNEITWFKI